MKRNRIAAVILILIFTMVSVNISSNAAVKVKTTGIYVKTPTQSQIIQFVKDHPILAGSGSKVAYDIVPSVRKPFSAGKVSAKFLKDGLNAVNIVRYIAGIPSNVVLDDEYNGYAQAGAVINSANNRLEHTPQKPEGMDDDFYDAGYTGTSCGNISYGNPLISETIVSGYMDDGDPSNITCIGHRRWVLNPPMESTGFGYTPAKYSVMYAFDNADGYVDDNYSVTAWPAQNTPVEYFDGDYPYSLSLSSDFDDVDRNKIVIKMVRMSDGKVFYFNSKTSDNENSKSYFNVNNDNYGQPHCIIWRPDTTGYKNGDAYSVEISGITKGEVSYLVSYNISFFSLGNKNTGSNTSGKTPVISNLALGLTKMNPNKDTLKISFSADKECLFYCKVYDKNNNRVATIANGAKLNKAGNWYVTWKGLDDNKKILKPGVYRINAYLGNSNGYSKALGESIEIVGETY